MDIITKTRELGKVIQQSEEYKALQAAKDANDADTALQDLIGKFNLIRIDLSEELSKDDKEKDSAKVEKLQNEVRGVYQQIMVNENMIAYNNAKHLMEDIMGQVNGILTLCVNGEDPDTCEVEEGCSGSCESCGGCH